MSRMFKRSLNLLSLLPFVVLVFSGVNNPLVGPYANQSASYALQAQNYLKFGFANLSFAPLDDVSMGLDANSKFYLHHPPLMQIVVALSQAIFGSNNVFSVRLPFTIASIVSVYLMSCLVRKIFGHPWDYVSYLLCLSLPMMVSFSNLVQFEILLLPIVLLCSLIWLNFVEKPNFKNVLILGTLVVIGLLIDWPMAFMSGFLFISTMILKGFKNKKSFVLLFMPVLFALGFFIYTGKIVGNWDYLLNAFTQRSYSSIPFNLPNPLLYSVLVFLIRFVVYFGPLGFLSTVYYFVAKGKTLNPHSLLTISLGLFALANVVIFPNGAYIHPYWMYYFIPFVLLSMIGLIKKLMTRSKKVKTLTIVLVMINLVFTTFVIAFKSTQFSKALWQNDFVSQLGKRTEPDSRLLINWDFNPDLVRFSLRRKIGIFWSLDDPKEYIQSNVGNFDYLVYSCWTNCPKVAQETFVWLDKTYAVEFADPANRAKTYNLHKPLPVNCETQTDASQTQEKSEINLNFSRIYRQVRDYFALEQI